MRPSSFYPTPESEARILLLIHAFSEKHRSLEGRTKLAKLDFLLRYPEYLRRALRARSPSTEWPLTGEPTTAIENRMIRYRYGPWDPAYFVLLGRLIGKGLVDVVPGSHGLHYRTSSTGARTAAALSSTEAWADILLLTELLKEHFDLAGTTLKKFIYETFPEVSGADWGERL